MSRERRARSSTSTVWVIPYPQLDSFKSLCPNPPPPPDDPNEEYRPVPDGLHLLWVLEIDPIYRAPLYRMAGWVSIPASVPVLMERWRQPTLTNTAMSCTYLAQYPIPGPLYPLDYDPTNPTVGRGHPGPIRGTSYSYGAGNASVGAGGLLTPASSVRAVGSGGLFARPARVVAPSMADFLAALPQVRRNTPT